MTSYDGNTYTNDAIGNRTYDGTWSYTWEHGRQLATMTSAGESVSFTYGADGLRISKTVTEGTSITEYHYYYNGSSLTDVIDGEGNRLHIIYDGSGSPLGFTYGGATYFYEKNLQGDILGIRNSSGTIVVSYSYDEWGSPESTADYSGSSLAEINPLRYRGYIYDEETELYYVSSRYYDPEACRWISPEPNVYDGGYDSGAGILAYNVYSYCANNSIGLMDTNGEGITLACILIGAGIGLIVGAVGGSHYAKYKKGLSPSDGWDYWKNVVFGGIGGGALGGLAGWAFAGSGAAASISWTYYKATTTIGTSSYAIGRAFEKWFYKAYGVVEQQVRHMGYRFDAIYKNSIVELKNYNWEKYGNLNGIINSFTQQARNYLQFVGATINGQTIKGITFCFSSRPPQEIINALHAIGVTVNWLP